jgi:AcrR family transcriptional regulator
MKVKASVPIWRKEDRTAHIYRVAAGIMCKKGYEATSMNDIAEAVGLTKAGLYHYIRGKEDLLFQIMSFGMDMVDEDVIAPARRIGDPESRLRAVVERHCRRIMEQGGAVTILLEEMPALTPAHQRVIRNRKRGYFELVRDTLGELSAEGSLRELDSTVAAFTLFGMILWTSRWYRHGGTLTPEQAAADLGEMAMNAVLNGSRQDRLPESTGGRQGRAPNAPRMAKGGGAAKAPGIERGAGKGGVSGVAQAEQMGERPIEQPHIERHVEQPIKRPIKQPVRIADGISGKGASVPEIKIFGAK